SGAAVVAPFVRAEPNFLTWARATLGGTAPDRTVYLCLINGRGDKADDERAFTLGAPTHQSAVWTLPYRRFRDETTQATWLVHCEATYDGNTYNLAANTTLSQTADF